MYNIDSHCHLDSELFPRWREMVFNAKKSGVKKIISVLSEPSYLNRLSEMTEEPDLYFVAGCHPHHATEYINAFDKYLINWIEKYRDRVVALGEIGLDFHYNFSPQSIQKEVFKRQLQVAREFDLPVVIHTREAGEETLKILEETESFQHLRILFHCYSQSEGFLAPLLSYPEVHFSFSGIITFKKADFLRRQLQRISLANLQVETDSPYLAPAPYRGKQNKPEYLPFIVENMADTLHIHSEILKEILTKNTLRFYGIEDREIPQEIAYEYKGNLYLNITSYCGLQCPFCIKKQGSFGDLPLFLKQTPHAGEVIQRLQDFPLTQFGEVVFCGYGEPTLNLSVLLEVSRWIKNNTSLKIRVNTNGLGNFFNKYNIIPALVEYVDRLNISLNASSPEEYRAIMNIASFQPDYYFHIQSFLQESKKFYKPEYLCISAVRSCRLDEAAFKSFALKEGFPYRLRP